MASSNSIPDPSSFNHRLAQVNGHQYHFVDEGPKEAPLIVLVHGFPESWFCWVYQILFLSRELGFRVVAVDKPGYGETNVGKNLANYSIKNTCKDLNEIVKNVIGREKAIFIGHDWGSQVCWMMSLYFPERVDGIVGISVPFFPPRPEFYELREVATHFPCLGYQVALAEGNIDEFNSGVRNLLECFWSRSYPDPKKSVLYTPFGESLIKYSIANSSLIDFPPKEIMDYMVSQFQLQGCEGPSNWYRTHKINFEDASEFPLDVKIKHKALMIIGENDFLMEFVEDSLPHYAQLKKEIMEGGHWITISHHEAVNKHISDFLNSLDKHGIKSNSQPML